MKAGLLKTGRFTRAERVKRSKDIKKLFREGKRYTVEGCKVFILQNNLDINRIVFALPRGYGRAVDRNRSKRLNRESYRKLKSNMNIGYDILLLTYLKNDTFATRCTQINCLFEKAGLMKT